MQTITAHPTNTTQINAIKAFMKALKVKFDVSKEEKSPYDPEFVAKILESSKQVAEGKTVKIPLKDLWK